MMSTEKRKITRMILLGTLLLVTLVATPALAQWMGGGMGCQRGRAPDQAGSTATLPDAGSPGARAFVATCARCHALPDPGAYSAAQWPAIVGRMEGYMQNRGGGLTASENRAIVGYLQKNGRQE